MSKDLDSDQGFEFLDHPADVWVHAWGPTLEAAMAECVRGLMQTMIEVEITPIAEKEETFIEVKGELTKGSLLIAFLSEFLYLFDVEDKIFNRVVIDPLQTLPNGNLHLTATGYGDLFDSTNYTVDVEVKAITYSYLDIHETPTRTDIKIVYDI